MKTGAMILLALAASAPARAATIVQTLTFPGGGGSEFQPFDRALGRLDSVTLVSEATFTRGFMLIGLSDTPYRVQAVISGLAETQLGSVAIAGTQTSEPGDVGFFVNGAGVSTVAVTGAARDRFIGTMPFQVAPVFSADVEFALVSGDGFYLFDENLVRSPGTLKQTITFDFTPAVTAVPEPAAWAYLLIGFAGIGGAIRTSRRRLATAPAA